MVCYSFKFEVLYMFSFMMRCNIIQQNPEASLVSHCIFNNLDYHYHKVKLCCSYQIFLSSFCILILFWIYVVLVFYRTFL